MTLYYTSLKKYSRIYRAIEAYFIRLAVLFDLDDVIERVQAAKQTAMAERLEMLIRNIRKCNYAFELAACKNLYQIICLQYPEFAPLYSKSIGDCIERQELIIKQSFNK